MQKTWILITQTSLKILLLALICLLEKSWLNQLQFMKMNFLKSK